MNKKSKKLICTVIAATIVSMAFVGCGKKVSDPAKVTPEVKAFDVNTASDLKLKVWQSQGTDLLPDTAVKGADNMVQNWLTQKTKVTIATEDIQGNGGQNWIGKLTMLAAGGNLPDIALGGVNGLDVVKKLVESGKTWELTPEILQKYAPNIYKSTTDAMWVNTKINGKIYGIPFNFFPSKELDPKIDERYLYGKGVEGTNSGLLTNCFVIRDDISKKLFPESKTYKELTAELNSKGEKASTEDILTIPLKSKDSVVKMFYDIQKLGLKEAGKDVFPLAFPSGDTWTFFSQLMPNVMGNWNVFMMTQFDLKSQTIKFGMQQPLYKEFGGLLNKMIRDKVCEPESLLQTPAQYTEKALAGRYAVVNLSKINLNYETINNEMAKAGKAYGYVPFLTQVPVDKDTTPYVAPAICGGTLMILKTDTVKTEKELAQVLNYYDKQYTAEFLELSQWGPKEAALYKEVDGKRQFVDEKLNNVVVKGLVDETVTTAYKKGLVTYDGYRQILQYITNPYNASVVNKTFIPTVSAVLGKNFNIGSKYQVKEVGPSQNLWDTAFAGVAGANDSVTGWQDKYDNAFKASLVSTTDAQFNTKWDEAEKKLSTIVSDKMLAEMTVIAKKEYDAIKAKNK